MIHSDVLKVHLSYKVNLCPPEQYEKKDYRRQVSRILGGPFISLLCVYFTLCVNMHCVKPVHYNYWAANAPMCLKVDALKLHNVLCIYDQ